MSWWIMPQYGRVGTMYQVGKEESIAKFIKKAKKCKTKDKVQLYMECHMDELYATIGDKSTKIDNRDGESRQKRAYKSLTGAISSQTDTAASDTSGNAGPSTPPVTTAPASSSSSNTTYTGVPG